MNTFQCAQRGCEFEAESSPENCPVCNNPFFAIVAFDDVVEEDVPWSDYTNAELRAQLEEWGITGATWRTNKAGLIALAEAAQKDADPDA